MTTSQKTGGLGSRVMLGAGSLSKRRKGIYWLVYKDEAGRLIQTNSRTADWDEAERMLAQAVFPMLAARLERIRELAYGKKGLRGAGDRSPAGRARNDRSASAGRRAAGKGDAVGRSAREAAAGGHAR